MSTSSDLGVATIDDEVEAAPTDGRPAVPVLQVDSPAEGSVFTGLIPICGWAFTAEAGPPEGVVELAIDDEDVWVELSDRIHVGGIDPGAQWARRCGFQAALNTFSLANGKHRLRLRLKVQSGRVAGSREVNFRVDNVGELAKTTTRLLKHHPKTKRIWVDAIDSEDFPYAEGRGVAWFDRPDAEACVREIMAKHKLAPRYEAHLHHFLRNGYIVLEDFVPKEWCERINRDLEALINTGVFHYGSKGQRVEKLFTHSKAARDLWAHPEILKLLSAIYDDVALPCQTLNFIHGSQQAVHQDMIHLTPFPAGMMCGVWVALEDIHPDSGPLVVYPGSHRLPRLYTKTVGVKTVRDGNWAEFAAKYTPKVMENIAQAGLKPEYYTPKAGSVLIWHENLAHGGSHRKDDTLTRKSMVSHYFARGGLAFYDSTGLPAWTHYE